ncbi:hypothetical protein NC651_035636 [Populus alba x Populus x berolinensis]|nr:hypothetical protein NC651_035636 [Populus alba x Populus x berolinensis]
MVIFSCSFFFFTCSVATSSDFDSSRFDRKLCIVSEEEVICNPRTRSNYMMIQTSGCRLPSPDPISRRK